MSVDNSSDIYGYNYSGYGSVEVDFDDLDDAVKSKLSDDKIYDAILDELNLNRFQMNQILNKLTKQTDDVFTFIRPSSDYKILFFEDSKKHVLSVSLQKIIDVGIYNIMEE